MLINSRNRLACRIRVDQLGKKISVAPLPGLPVVKDLIVDMNGFFGKYRSVKPYLINDQPEPERERRQSPEDRAQLRRHDQMHPVRGLHELHVRPSGPGPNTSARRRSSRPTASSSTPATKAPPRRLEILSDENGVWRCRTIFNCVDACPRGINITRAILEVSSAIVGRRG